MSIKEKKSAQQSVVEILSNAGITVIVNEFGFSVVVFERGCFGQSVKESREQYPDQSSDFHYVDSVGSLIKDLGENILPDLVTKLDMLSASQFKSSKSEFFVKS